MRLQIVTFEKFVDYAQFMTRFLVVLTRVFCLYGAYVSLFEVDLLVLQGCTPGLCQDPSTSLWMTQVVKRFDGGA